MKKFLTVFLLLLFSVQLFADDDEKLKLAVMEFEDLSGNLPPKMLSVATEQIRGKFVSSNKFIVIAKERQEKAMIKEMKKESYKACNDKSCQIPLGQALSADTILRTTITFFGGAYTITSELIDLAKEATVKGAEATFDGSEKSLKEAINSIVAQIVGIKQQTKSNFQTGRFGEDSGDWEIGGEEETIVKFESNPAGAVVMADGKLLCQSTPCSKMLTKGNHQIEMQKENYVAVSQKQEIKEGKTVKYTLEPDFAWLNVSGNYAVSIRLDGQNIGKIPINEKVINPGNHKIEHTDGCFYNSGEAFTVKRGEKKDIRLDLKHRESAIKVYAQDENGNDIDADVFVDDEKVGRAPGTFKIPLCSKEMRVKKSGYSDYSEKLSLQEKQVKTFQAKIKAVKQARYEKKEPEKKAEPTEEDEFKKELWDAGKRTRIAVATSTLVAGVVVGVLGGVSLYGASKSKKDRDKWGHYYEQSETQEDMDKYSKKISDAHNKINTYNTLGGIGLGLGAALIATGITFYCIEFKGEKEVKTKYNISFGTSLMDGTLQFSLNW